MRDIGKLSVVVPKADAASATRTDGERQELTRKFRERMQQRERQGNPVTIHLPNEPATKNAALPQVASTGKSEWELALAREWRETKEWVRQNPLKSLLIGVGIGATISALTRPQAVVIERERRIAPSSQVSGLSGVPKRRRRTTKRKPAKGRKK